MHNARIFVPAALLAVGCALISGVREQRALPLVKPLATLPTQMAGYSGRDLPVSEEEQRVAGMTNYVFRVFGQDSRDAFSVYVGYYQSQTTGKSIHSPRNCLPGAGWQPLEKTEQAIQVGSRTVYVNRYLLADSTGQALVYYWYQGRGRVASNEYRVKWDLLRDAALNGRTEEALVRIMVPVQRTRSMSETALHDAQRKADDLARAVAERLVPEVDHVLPAWQASSGSTPSA
jgi:EpsI family protein